MIFRTYQERDISEYSDLAETVEQIARCPEVLTHKAWYGEHPSFAGWFVNWSMCYIDEETDPDSRVPDAYGVAKTPDRNLMFWWKRIGENVNVSGVSELVEMDL
jgi:hypothetical protein